MIWLSIDDDGLFLGSGGFLFCCIIRVILKIVVVFSNRLIIMFVVVGVMIWFIGGFLMVVGVV